MMLNTIVFDVLNEKLNGNVFSVECEYSKIFSKPILYVTVGQVIEEKDFINKTKGLISEADISFSDNFHFNIDLTKELVKRIIDYAGFISMEEFLNMKK
jgi:hypothetical protein